LRIAPPQADLLSVRCTRLGPGDGLAIRAFTKILERVKFIQQRKTFKGRKPPTMLELMPEARIELLRIRDLFNQIEIAGSKTPLAWGGLFGIKQ
jgi:hypothetical protein